MHGVEYYNDSKATNVDATIKALESFTEGVHLILGGKDKGSDYTVLNDLLHDRVKAVYTIGAAATKIEAQVSGAEVDPRANARKRDEAGVATARQGRRGAACAGMCELRPVSKLRTSRPRVQRTWFTRCKQQESK